MRTTNFKDILKKYENEIRFHFLDADNENIIYPAMKEYTAEILEEIEVKLKETFSRESTPEEKADAIIDYLQSKGLTPDQILQVIKIVKIKLIKK